MNLHTPERQGGETREQYRERQQASRDAVKAAQAMPPAFRPNKPLSAKRAALLRRIALHRAATGQRPKFAPERKHKPAKPMLAPLDGRPVLRCMLTGRNAFGERRVWRGGEPVHNLNPNRERDPGKREKPKSAVAKRMDRPERVALIDRGHAKLMRFFGVV